MVANKIKANLIVLTFSFLFKKTLKEITLDTIRSIPYN
jgi:hypothetical protein